MIDLEFPGRLAQGLSIASGSSIMSNDVHVLYCIKLCSIPFNLLHIPKPFLKAGDGIFFFQIIIEAYLRITGNEGLTLMHNDG